VVDNALYQITSVDDQISGSSKKSLWRKAAEACESSSSVRSKMSRCSPHMEMERMGTRDRDRSGRKQESKQVDVDLTDEYFTDETLQKEGEEMVVQRL
jgi:hypothetical protein